MNKIKSAEKKERIRLLYELESKVMKENKSKDDKNRIKELRNTLILDDGYKGLKRLNLTVEQYFKYHNSGVRDSEIAKILGVNRQSISRFKQRNGIVKKQRKIYGEFDLSVIEKGVFCPKQYEDLVTANYSNQEICELFEIPIKRLTKMREQYKFK